MCLMPALDAISRRHPGAVVELMARFELARLVAGRSVVARAHSIDAREVGELFADQTSGARRFFGEFDRIYSFFASDDARFRERLAAAADGEVSFHSFRPGGESHVSEGYLKAIGEDASMLDARLEPTAEDLAAARVLLESKCDISNLVVIFPGSGSPAKNWPADKFVALASMLAKRSGILRFADSALNDTRRSDSALNDTRRPRAGPPAPLTATSEDTRQPLAATSDDARHSGVVVLGPAEASIEAVFRESGVPVLKDLDLPTVAAIARIASAFVANDSGVAHLAAAVGASGVVIFGPTDPVRWRPIGHGHIDILRRELIDSIEVSEVAGVLLKFVERQQR